MNPALTLPVLAAMLGFALARANTCTVASVERWVIGGKPDWLAGLAVAAAASGATLAVLDAAGVTMQGFPTRLMPGWGAVAGGALIGLGALANRACMLGSISQLGRGNANYLLTLAGMTGSLALAPVLGGAWGRMSPAGMTMTSERFMAGQYAPLVAGLFGAALLPALYRLLRHRETAWLYLIATGVLGGLIFALNPGWSYLAAIGRGMRGEWGGTALVANIAALCLFAGATVSLWLRDSLDIRRIALGPGLGCLVGGLTMGTGAQLVPGGNDTLLLWTVPGLAWYGALAYLSMMAVIAAVLYARRWRAMRK